MQPMNYLKQLNAFYDRQETQPLTLAAVSLWHALMMTGNRAQWPEWFSASVAVLILKAALSEKMFYRARQELETKGYVLVQEGKHGQASMYKVIILYAFNAQNQDAIQIEAGDGRGARGGAREGERGVGKEGQRTGGKGGQKEGEGDWEGAKEGARGGAEGGAEGVLVNETKENETKGDETTTTNTVYTFYEENGFGFLQGYLRDEIQAWYDEDVFDEPDEVIILAMKVALEANKQRWGYVKGILKNWHTNSWRTVAEIEAETFHEQKTMADKPRGRAHEEDGRSFRSTILTTILNSEVLEEKSTGCSRFKFFLSTLNSQREPRCPGKV
ncbi:DnaD domain-containing protein [Shouchella shacheensis]|uniref:DnaD domain-containing protein n=1 Tax=Shouchella shacheensis TaxID=1649580 RepID=UPI00073FC364|nr:DnaD domain protein [Shouchella shacheensis]